MTMTHLLLCSHEQAVPRWSRAFPGNPQVTSLSAATDLPGVLWIHTGVADWEERTAQQAAAGQRVVVLSNTPAPQDTMVALRAGARGYAHAWANESILQQVALVVENGGIWVGPDMMENLIKLSAARNTDQPTQPGVDWSLLSVREMQVAEAVQTGASNKEIARQLNITERTVKAHLTGVFHKLNIRDRLHLAICLKERTPSEALKNSE